jgi:hypothetical protein
MKGALVLGYGPMATAEDNDILGLLNDGRGEESLQPDASPADTARQTVGSAEMQSADVANGERP